MCARQNPTDSRDRAIARQAAEALRSQISGTQGGTQDCPDAGLIAAYSERSTTDEERLQLETHFAACERCQQTLAALGTALDAAPLEVPAIAPPLAIAPARSPRRWMWWLTPAFGAAAAALLWMVLRPTTPRPVEVAADYSRAAPAQQEIAPRNEVAQNQNKVASPPRAEKDTANAPASRTGAIAEPASADALDKVRRDSEAKSTADTLSASAQAAPSAAAPRALAGSPPVAENQSPARQERTFSAARAAAPAAAPAVSAQSALAGRLNAAASPQPITRYTFTSPTGDVMWRLGDAGSIEKSSDRGKTWQAQVSGATEDLIVGSSSSDQVAWVIGRNGIILRTTDGQSWTRILPPPGVIAQWSVIAAHDAMSATVFADDFRRFVTADGGQTWSLEP
jgi:hypothetical protein